MIFPFTVHNADYYWVPVREPDYCWSEASMIVKSETEVEFQVVGWYKESGWTDRGTEKLRSFERILPKKKLEKLMEKQIHKTAVELYEEVEYRKKLQAIAGLEDLIRKGMKNG